MVRTCWQRHLQVDLYDALSMVAYCKYSLPLRRTSTDLLQSSTVKTYQTFFGMWKQAQTRPYGHSSDINSGTNFFVTSW